MDWRKLGRVYVAGGEHEWATSHAYCPTSILLDEERIRVFVAFLDRDQVGRVGYVDVAAEDPTKVLEVSAAPVLDVGAPGMFDDNGVTPLSVCRDGDLIRLYYAGWQLGVRVRYFLFLGLASSTDGGASFLRERRVPVLDRSESEPVVRSSAHVRKDRERWQMWYAAGDRWREIGGKQVPTYSMRYLESADGIEWAGQGEPCLELRDDDEFGFARPYVVEDGGAWRMWFSIRSASKGYRLGYAESGDGRAWERKDAEAGIDVSDSGWDSEMIGLSCLQQTEYGTYLFYNGNDFGATGFGVAVAER
jgi:predicted GH43/DUF377 family glycosyl hydrolase